MRVLKIRDLNSQQFSSVNELWNAEYPIKLKNRLDLLLKDSIQVMHYILEEEGQIIAWAVWFEKDNEIRFSIIVNERLQGRGFGKALVDALKGDLNEFYGWVIDHDNDLKQNGDHYQSPLKFYQKQGFTILPDFRIDNEMLKAVKIHWKRK